MLDISHKLFSAWNNAGLLYCHWKSNEHLVPGLDGDTDLDVLLSSLDRGAGEEILKELDFLKCRSQYGSRYPGVDDWIGFDRLTGKQIHLHLHYHIITGHKGMKEFSLPWTEIALQTRILDKDTEVYIMEPNLEILTIYTRIALKISIKDFGKKYIGHYKVSKSSLREIKWLKERIDWSETEHLVQKFYGVQASVVTSIMRKDKLLVDDVFKLKKIAEKTFRPYNRVGWHNVFIEFYYTFVSKHLLKLHHRIKGYVISRKTPASGKGLTIAFLGQDGAGKTTVTSELRRWLKWKLDVRYTYLGCGDNYHSWRKTALKVLPNNILFRVIRVWLILSKYTTLSKDVINYIKSGEKYADHGGIQIFDRYPQIQFEGISDGPKLRVMMLKKLPSFLRKIFSFMADIEEKRLSKVVDHQPDMVFKLLLPPEESVRRKPENKLESMIQKHELIKALQFGGNTKVYEIDATMPYEQEIVLIKNIIWDSLIKE